jgi:hypothetical protein
LGKLGDGYTLTVGTPTSIDVWIATVRHYLALVARCIFVYLVYNVFGTLVYLVYNCLFSLYSLWDIGAIGIYRKYAELSMSIEVYKIVA